MSASGPGAVSGSGEAWAGYAGAPASQGVVPNTARVLSIDLGTSNTVAVLSAHGWPPRVVDLDGASAMPSAVFAAEDGRLVVGREALRLARTAPARFEPNPKRRVDEGNLLLGDAVVPVATALGAVLGKVLAEASRQLGGVMPDQVRLTHPAQWGSAGCAELLEAARQAGLGANVQLMPEPVAAAAHFASVTGRVLAPGQTLAVYDLGAGTFDVAVVGAGQQGLTVLAESGLPDLGGLDIDQALLDHLGRQVAERDPAVTAPYAGDNSQENTTDLTWFDTKTGERLRTTDAGARPVRPDLGNGVVVWTGGRSWEYTLRDTSEVRLMGVDESAVTLMVVKPGPAALYTVSGPNKMEQAPELDPEVAEELEGVEHSYRVGDYLVCGFNDGDDGPVIGVVRMTK